MILYLCDKLTLVFNYYMFIYI